MFLRVYISGLHEIIVITDMDSGVSMYLFYSLMYGFFCLCVIAPPTEFVSAGLTIQHIFSSFLGSEDMTFIEYHIKRTTVTAFVHSLLPLGKLWGAPARWWISMPLIVIRYTMTVYETWEERILVLIHSSSDITHTVTVTPIQATTVFLLLFLGVATIFSLP